MEVEEAESEEELHPLREANRTQMRESEETMSKAFAAGDLAAAKFETIRMTYFCRINEVITAKT